MEGRRVCCWRVTGKNLSHEALEITIRLRRSEPDNRMHHDARRRCRDLAEGDLLVACHSGAPDWGTGPEGAGQSVRISAEKDSAPRPVAAYFATAGELRVTFDKELDPAKLRDLTRRTEIVAGRYAAAGDRFESFRPGYQVVRDQMAAPRRDVPVLGATLAANKHTIGFAIPPQGAAEHYAVTIPDFISAPRQTPPPLHRPRG